MVPQQEGAAWRKSSRSGNSGGECVELGHADAWRGVRDSKNADGPVLRFSPTGLAAFLGAAKAGRFDR